MNNFVEFSSNKFPVYDDEEDMVNPGLWGRKLAEYLQQHLNAAGINTAEIFCEDWGWVVPIKADKLKYWLGCGHQYGDDNDFICFTGPAKFNRRAKGGDPMAQEQLKFIASTLDAILDSDPDISGVSWREEYQ